MRFSSNSLRGLLFSILLVLVLVASAANAYAEPITRLSGVPELDSLKKYYALPNFLVGGKYDLGNESAFELGEPVDRPWNR